MKKLLALINARNKEFYRDKTAMGWTLIFPIIVLLGFTYGYSGKQDPILKVAVANNAVRQSPLLQNFFSTPGIEIKTSTDQANALKKVSRFELDLLLSIEGEPSSPKIVYATNSDSDKGKLAEWLLANSFAKQPGPAPKLEPKKLEGRRVQYSEWVLPGLIAMNIMFGSMFGVGYVIVRYRKNGVLKRLRATPLSAFQFLLAQVVSRMLLMVLTALLVLGIAMLLIGVRNQGSWLDLALFLMVSSVAMISVGLLVAARISSEEVADGVLNLMTWPMIFLSGIWFSIDDAAGWVTGIAKAMPLSHVVRGLRGILLDGTTLAQLSPQIGILLAISAFFILISAAIFRWR